MNIDYGKKLYIKKDEFKNIIRQMNLTQNELSEMIGINQSDLSKMVMNKNYVNSRIQKEMCELLNCKESDIFTATKHVTNASYVRVKTLETIHHIPNGKWNNNYFKKSIAKSGFTIKKLSGIIDKHASVFSKYNLEQAHPTVETVYAICKALNCSPKRLVGVGEEELNKIMGYKLFEEGPAANAEVEEFTEIPDAGSISPEPDLSESVGKGEDDKDDNDSHDTEYVYQRFADQNVINNMNIINENILTLVKELRDTENRFINNDNDFINKLTEEYEKQAAVNEMLFNKLLDIETKLVSISDNVNSVNDKNDKKSQMQKKETCPIATIWNNQCSEKEMQQIVNSKVSEDTEDAYKKKTYKLINYISKKQNLIFNQVMHNNYSQFEKVYGCNINMLKAESKTANSISAIYDNPLYREIFFNMLSDNALHA